MATETKTESARSDTGTRTASMWMNQVADTAGTGEYRVVETEPTYTDLFNYYTKLDRPKESRNSP